MSDFEFINGYAAPGPAHRGCVATLGSFDGMHLGHQAILQRLVAKGQALNLPVTVILFEPQPAEFFNPQQAPARLMRLREKVEALQRIGVNRVLCLRFNAALCRWSAAEFVQQILVDRLGVKHLEVGDDFRFGRGREGDFNFLTQAAGQWGFSLANSDTFCASAERVSSTRIRNLLAQDNLLEAAALLGRPYTMMGRVMYGRQLARTLGAPTANIAIGRYRSPLLGVFAVRVWGAFGECHAVANLGVKPTVTAGHISRVKPLLEVHLLDFSQNLYGQCVRVEFCCKLRGEQKFASLDALKAQIALDIQNARDHFQNLNKA